MHYQVCEVKKLQFYHILRVHLDVSRIIEACSNFYEMLYQHSNMLTNISCSEVVWKGTSLHSCKTELERKGDKSGTKARVELEPEKMNFLSDTSPGTTKLSRPCTLNSLLVCLTGDFLRHT